MVGIMDSRPPKIPLWLYRETRVGLEPSHPNSILHIQLPSNNSFTRTTRTQRKLLSGLPPSKTEEEFKRRNIASASSIYFRKSGKYPRSFLWRCLEDNAVLELRSLDLAKSDKETREPVLILRFGFPSPIRTGCVAFADSHELDILSVFVVTKTNNLYTFTLRPSFFCRAEASEDDSATWCKSFRPSPFTISAPHRLFATNPFELLAALGDGRLARLTRPTNGDGTDWDERTYNDGQWGTSLRGLIRWQGNNTIRHDGAMLETETALSTMESPDGKHIFAVCLNHTLRAWNKETGKLTLSRDLLDIQRGPQETAKMSLNPGLARVLSVFEVKDSKEGDLYYILTFSPHDNGIFKFWGIRDAEHADAGIRDLAPDYDFKVPDPNDGAPWTMADFKLKRSGGASRVGIWILMRLNRRYKLYHRIFDLNNLADEDESEWSVTMTDTSKAEPCCEPPIKVIDLDPEDNTDKWLMYLLSPGRFQGTVLETALSIYIQARDLTLIKNSKASLKERIGSYVGSHLKLRQMGTSTSSYKKFAEDVNAEWISFWTIVTDLDQHRKEPLGLGFDEDANMPWVVLGDGCSAIRECSEIELLAYNEAAQMPRDGGLLPSTELPDPGSDPKNADELAMLVEAAAKFRSTFSDTLQFSCKNVLTTELWQDSSLSITARIQTFYDQCNFADEIGDRQYNDLASSLRRIDGFDGLNTSMFYGILQTLPQYRSSEASGLLSTRFGLRVLVNGAQDMVALHTRILTDLLLLLVFVDADVDRDECPMDSLDTPRVFVELLDQLKQNETALWLATSIRPDPTNTQQNQTQLKPTAGAQPVTSTLLENMFAVYLPPQSYIKYSQHAPLTNNMRDLLKWVTGGNNPEMSLDQILVHIQCNLLKNNNLDLATLFLQYQPSTAWAAYVRGRLYLLHGTHNVAATHFQKAAFKLSRPNPPFKYTAASASLLDPLSASFLSTGLSNYYTHILHLFAPLHAHAQIRTFATLALQHLPTPPAPAQHSDLLSALFHAALATAAYTAAYTALMRYSDKALQRRALAALVDAMGTADAVAELLDFPFAGLAPEVDALLLEKAQGKGGAAWSRILYAWRVRRGDLRGAAQALVESGFVGLGAGAGFGGWGGVGGTGHREPAEADWLVLINALVVGGGEEGGYVFVRDRAGTAKRGVGIHHADGDQEMDIDRGADADGAHGAATAAGAEGVRRVVRLRDVRRAYEAWVERRERVQRGAWGIVGDGGDA